MEQGQFGISILTLGTVKSNGNRKIYITNKNLEKSLPAGTKVLTQYNDKDREIVFIKRDDDSANHTISSKTNGTPVLDLKNKFVGETIGDVDTIEVQFYKNKVVVRVPKTTLQKEARAEKHELSVFEICAGAGTFTNMMEQHGFVSKGVIELKERNIAIYHENHKDEDVFTVCGNIEDVDENMLPKGVTTGLVTIPCTGASNGNRKLKEAIKNKKLGKPYDKEIIEEMERLDALMYFALKIVEKMNFKTIIFENVEGFTKNPYDSSLERGVYTLAKTVLKAKGYKLSEYVGESHNTIRKRWVMIAHYGDFPISLENFKIDQTLSRVKDHLAVPDSERKWGTKDSFAPSRLRLNNIGIRGVKLDDYITPTFSTHATRREFPILHKKENGEDLYSEFTPEDIKNIHGLSKDFIIPEQKTVAYEILGQGVASMFKDVARIVREHYDKEEFGFDCDQSVNNIEYEVSKTDAFSRG